MLRENFFVPYTKAKTVELLEIMTGKNKHYWNKLTKKQVIAIYIEKRKEKLQRIVGGAPCLS